MNGNSSLTGNNGSTFGHNAGGEADINIKRYRYDSRE